MFDFIIIFVYNVFMKGSNMINTKDRPVTIRIDFDLLNQIESEVDKYKQYGATRNSIIKNILKQHYELARD